MKAAKTVGLFLMIDRLRAQLIASDIQSCMQIAKATENTQCSAPTCDFTGWKYTMTLPINTECTIDRLRFGEFEIFSACNLADLSLTYSYRDFPSGQTSVSDLNQCTGGKDNLQADSNQVVKSSGKCDILVIAHPGKTQNCLTMKVKSVNNQGFHLLTGGAAVTLVVASLF